MERTNDNEKSFNRNFNRSLIALVIPIALQNLISAAVNSADIVMLSTISQSAMSAVSLAGQISLGRAVSLNSVRHQISLVYLVPSHRYIWCSKRIKLKIL